MTEEEFKRCEMCGIEETEERLCWKCENKIKELDDREGWIKDKRKNNIEDFEKRIEFLENLK